MIHYFPTQLHEDLEISRSPNLSLKPKEFQEHPNFLAVLVDKIQFWIQCENI